MVSEKKAPNANPRAHPAPAANTRHAPASPAAPAFSLEPTLARALFKLNTALTFEDFADAVEMFCETTVPHDSRALGVAHADYRACDYTTLVERYWNAPAPGAAYVDEDLRNYLGDPDTLSVSTTPGVPVWHRKNSFAHFGARNDAEYFKTEFFRRVAEPERWVSNLCMPFWIDGNIHSLFWIKRGEGRTPFTDAEVRFMEHYHPWLLATLKRVRLLEENRAHKNDISHALFDIPVPTFLLDWNLRVVQRNAAADDACAAWRHGPDAARATKPPFLCAERVPVEIAAACREMKARWSAQFLPLNGIPPPPAGGAGSAVAAAHTHGFKQRLKIAHPANPRMEATITLLRPSALRLAHPSFLVRIHGAETPGENAKRNLGAPRNDANAAARAQEHRVRLLAQLTQAEREIVPLVARGMSDKEIAIALHKSVPTVKNQLHSAYEKLRVPSRAHLIAALK